MKSFVPDDIAWRLGKEHLGYRFTRQLIEESNDWDARLVELVPMLSVFASRSALTFQSGDGQDSGDQAAFSAMDSGTFVELFALGCWLARNDVRDRRRSAGE
jgi:hypothetical protein